jgi:uncharacterized protein YpuA (DUF1002 family)
MKVEKIINELGMYANAEDTSKLTRSHDTIIHELHTELDAAYDTADTNEIEGDIKEFEKYLEKFANEHHKKQILHQIIAYIEEKL